jgi:glucose-1-phosphate thymidylyltransferase
MTRLAVILARGLGTRMRKEDASARLPDDQARIAKAGMKGMIPIDRPFLEYVISALADAGYERVCLVIGPEHDAVREHFTRNVEAERISIQFAIQQKPLGTADAVLSAEELAGEDPFVVLNSDNYYPPRALEQLRIAEAPAVVGFARSALIAGGNVSNDRVSRFGALEFDDQGFLSRVVPHDGHAPAEHDGEIYSSMNCWLFTREIFDACRKVAVSPRGELELPRAVQLAIDTMGMKFRVIRFSEPVLDLSTRADVSAVASLLEGVEPRL